MMSNLVSIIIPVYNAEKTLAHAIDSVLQQTYPHIEIITVDDGSSDGSPKICQSFETRVRCFSQENRGASSARNLGIKQAEGEYIGFLDADDVYLPEKIEKLIALFHTYPEVGAVSGGFIQQGYNGNILIPEPGRVFPGEEDRGLIDYFRCEFRGCWVVHTNTILIKRSVLDEVGLFNEGFRFGEDVDLWCRIFGRYPMAFLDEPVALYDRTNEQSLCATETVLGQGVDYLYDRKQEKEYISRDRLPAYRAFKNKILLARLMLGIYERDRAVLVNCLIKLYPVPLNVRVVLGLFLLAVPTRFWPGRNRLFSTSYQEQE